MEPRVNVITLAVEDLERAFAFSAAPRSRRGRW
jgi:hypothetical protein